MPPEHAPGSAQDWLTRDQFEKPLTLGKKLNRYCPCGKLRRESVLRRR